MADSTLVAIQKKVRRLTRSPDTTLLDTTDLNEYINTFISFDMPSHVRLFNRLREFNFFCEPNNDLITITQPSPIITIHPPIFIGGYQVWYQQDPQNFYNNWPRNQFLETTTPTGDGVTLIFNGVLTQTPILRREVLINSVTATNDGLQVSDNGLGILTGDGVGTIDYLTGAFTVTWTTAPANGADINAQYVPYVASRPTSLLYYNNEIILRPVPDQVYRISVQAQQKPTELMAAADFPDIQQWWQYIAYGTAKKIFEDRMDMDSVQMIMPEFLKQEELVLRTTTNQLKEERVATIYTQQIDGFDTNFNNRNW